MIRLLLDQGLPRSAIYWLAEQGIVVSHVAELGMSQATDREIIDCARQADLVVVTLDADFHALIALSGERRPSVIRIRREGLDGRQVAEVVANTLAVVGEAIVQGAMVTVTETQVRVRHLPMQS